MEISEQWLFAQQSILGSVLIEPRYAEKLVFGVRSDDFISSYRMIYDAIRDLYTTGKPVDPVTVLDRIGGGAESRNLVEQLMVITPTAANIDAYIEVCRNCSLIHSFREIGAALQDIKTAEQAEEILSSINQTRVSPGMASWTMGEALHDFFQRYSSKSVYLPWFLSQLDPQLQLEFGDFCLLGGRPSSGKSAFALEAAVYWVVVCGYRVGFYSHETSREKLTNRMIAACTRVPLDDVKKHTLNAKQMQDVCSIASKISEAPIDLISCAGKTVAEMQTFALIRRHQIVIVDYLQIVAGSGKDEYSQVAAISKGLHVMCQSHGIFCLALCQLSRTHGAVPSLEDLRSSGQLEQDADAVLLLHNNFGEDNSRELIIAKNKEGTCKTTRLYFDGPIQHFSYVGLGERPLPGYDYRLKAGYHTPSKEVLDQFEILLDDSNLPFK